MDWKHLLAYISGSVDEELLRRNAYLVTENRLLRQQITGRVHLTDAERRTLAELGQQLGKQALEEVAHIVKPDTILAWHRVTVQAPKIRLVKLVFHDVPSPHGNPSTISACNLGLHAA